MPRPSNPRALADALPAMGNGGLYGSPLMHLRGIPSPVSVGKNAPGEERLSPATSIFQDLGARKFGRRDARWKRGDTHTGVAGRSLLGLGFWWGFWLRGLELYRAADIRRPGSSMNSFSKRIGWPRNDQKNRKAIVNSRLGKANTKG